MLAKLRKQSAFFMIPGILVLSLVSVGCDMDSENPNALVESDLGDPAVAAAMANGALNTTSNGIGNMLAPISVSSDEATWIGSRDAWGSLDKGQMSDVYNEFVDGQWNSITEGRWMADQAIKTLEAFQSEGVLGDVEDLARVYLYAGVVRVCIADWFEDFVYSDKTIPGSPFGVGNMMGVYDEAIALFKKGMSTTSSSEMKARFNAMLARAYFYKQVHTVIGNGGGFVTDSNAKSYAEAALNTWDETSKYQIEYSSTTVGSGFSWQINGRSELEFGIRPDGIGDPFPADLLDTDASVDVVDPQGNALGPADPRIAAIVNDFFKDRGGTDYAPITMISGAELYIMLAEMAGNDADAITHLNMNRTGMTPYDGSNATVADAIKHERRANLFATGRRMLDMYRFGETSLLWETQFEAKSSPGTLFPITIKEIRANPNCPLPG